MAARELTWRLVSPEVMPKFGVCAARVQEIRKLSLDLSRDSKAISWWQLC